MKNNLFSGHHIFTDTDIHYPKLYLVPKDSYNICNFCNIIDNISLDWLTWNNFTNIFWYIVKEPIQYYNLEKEIQKNNIKYEYETEKGKLIFWCIEEEDNVFFNNQEQKIINRLKA